MSDALNSRARAFLQSVQDADDPTHADQDRVHAKVKARLAAGIAAGIAALTTSKAAAATATGAVGAGAPTAIVAAGTGTAVVGKIAAVVVVVAAVAGGTAAVRHAQHAAAVTPSAATTAVTVAPRPTMKHGSTAPVAPVLPPAPEIAPQAPTAAATATATATATAPATAIPTEQKPVHVDSPHPAATAPVVTPSPLDEEIALVRDARAALRVGDAGRSLALLDEHDARFPGGALGEDCTAERIYALCALGRIDDARALATRFLADHPVSPHAASVRASCGGSAGGMN